MIPRLMHSELTGVWYIVTRYKDLGNRHFKAITKYQIEAEDLKAIRETT